MTIAKENTQFFNDLESLITKELSSNNFTLQAGDLTTRILMAQHKDDPIPLSYKRAYIVLEKALVLGLATKIPNVMVNGRLTSVYRPIKKKAQ